MFFNKFDVLCFLVKSDDEILILTVRYGTIKIEYESLSLVSRLLHRAEERSARFVIGSIKAEYWYICKCNQTLILNEYTHGIFFISDFKI